MYFVVSGQVAIIGEDLEEKVVLGPGTFFGEIALLMDTTRTATVRTKSTVTVMVFNRLDFNQCGYAYPACMETIREACLPSAPPPPPLHRPSPGHTLRPCIAGHTCMQPIRTAVGGREGSGNWDGVAQLQSGWG